MKQGYKQTDIGLIPEDWEIKDFGKVGDYYKGGGISMRDVRPTGFPCIMYGDIYVKFDTSFKECDYRIDYDTAKNSVKASPQDLFFTASGETADDIGRCVSYQGEDDIYIGGDIIALHPSDEYDSLFLAYVQNSENVKKQKASFAQGHSVVHISAENIKKTRFAAPKYPEQHRIAEALSDVDELIASLEKLIEKKKAIKQGVMQELLTGKRRLPGFTGEWKRKELSKIATMFAGGTPNTEVFEYYGGDIPWVSIADISNAGKYISSTQTNLSEAGLANSSAIWYPANTILFAMYASIGKCCITTCPMTSSQAILGIYDLTDCNVGFLYYQLLFRQSEFMNLKQTGTQSNLSKDIIGKIIIYLPSIPEQEVISLTLSDLDYEIDSLAHRLQKYYRLKSGMMSELLTGRIRLV